MPFPDWFKYVFLLLIGYSVLEIILAHIMQFFQWIGDRKLKKEKSGVANSKTVANKSYSITSAFFEFSDYNIPSERLPELIKYYTTNDFSPDVEEAYLIYLLIILANHQSSSYFDVYFVNLYSIALDKYNFKVPFKDLPNYRLGACFYNDNLTANI